MNAKRQVPARSLALVVMAAGVVTASPEFAVETVGEFAPMRLADTLLSFSGPTSGHKPTARR
jgi:hypothetical protein